MPRDLPDYEDPPVVETVLGVEFAPLKWSIPDFGLFWSTIRDEYPRVEVEPPIGSQIEKFGPDAQLPAQPTIELIKTPPVRCHFFDRSGTRLLQVQNDRFIHNWRKTGPKEQYPHYENIRPIFEKEWNRFCAFLAERELGAPEILQCEVTYVNHLERGKGWQNFGDLAGIIPCWSCAAPGQFLPTPEAVGLQTRYVMPEDRGRLYILLQPAIRHADAKSVLQLTLTARGRPASSEIADIRGWLDLGRRWVVRGFDEFTSPEMHAVWGRKEEL